MGAHTQEVWPKQMTRNLSPQLPPILFSFLFSIGYECMRYCARAFSAGAMLQRPAFSSCSFLVVFLLVFLQPSLCRLHFLAYFTFGQRVFRFGSISDASIVGTMTTTGPRGVSWYATSNQIENKKMSARRGLRIPSQHAQ